MVRREGRAALPVFGFEQLERQELALVDIKLNVEALSLDNRYPDYSACPIGFRSAIVRLSMKALSALHSQMSKTLRYASTTC